MIKKTLTAIAALAMAATTASAQQVTQKVEQMLVHLFDGNTVYYNVSDVDYVDYRDSTKLGYCPDGNHPHAIDLGLPSGTKWACCNVGATAPTQYGGYYAWGETEEKTKYNESNYSLNDYKITNIIGTEYDVAHVKMGDKWQMPTNDQIEELATASNLTWTVHTDEESGIKGLLATSTNGNQLFVPAAGNYWNSYGLIWDGDYVIYMSGETHDYLDRGLTTLYGSFENYKTNGKLPYKSAEWSEAFKYNGTTVRAVSK